MKPEKIDISECIGCGCDDLHACRGGGCTWLRVDRESGLGVCSNCPELVAAWDAGEFVQAPQSAQASPGLMLPDDPEFDATLHALLRR